MANSTTYRNLMGWGWSFLTQPLGYTTVAPAPGGHSWGDFTHQWFFTFFLTCVSPWGPRASVVAATLQKPHQDTGWCTWAISLSVFGEPQNPHPAVSVAPAPNLCPAQFTCRREGCSQRELWWPSGPLHALLHQARHQSTAHVPAGKILLYSLRLFLP